MGNQSFQVSFYYLCRYKLSGTIEMATEARHFRMRSDALKFLCLFRSQTLHRICHRRSDCLEADCSQRNKNNEDPGYGKNLPV